MDIIEKRHNIKMQLWVVPGILFVCCILLAILLQTTSTPVAFPMIAIIGMVASHLRTWRGVAISSALLLLTMAYFLQAQPSSLWIWTIALSLSIAATFVTTALCSDEAYHTWDALKQEETDHRQTIQRLNEKLQMLQGRPGYENKETHARINALQQQLETQEKQHRAVLEQLHSAEKQQAESERKLREQGELQLLEHEKLQAYTAQIEEYEKEIGDYQEQYRIDQEKLQAFAEQEQVSRDKLASHLGQQHFDEAKQRSYEDKQRTNEQLLKLARHEVVTAYANQEKLSQEIAALQSEYASLASAYEQAKSVINDEKLTSDYEQLASEHERLEAEYQALKNDKSLEQLKQRYEKLSLEYENVEKQLELLRNDQETQKSQYDELLSQHKSLKADYEAASENLVETREFRRIEGLYQQLRTQFIEKTDILNTTRKELFQAQEELQALQKDLEEASYKNENKTTQSLRQQLDEAEEERMALEQQHAAEVEQLHDLVDSLMRK